MGYEKKYNLWLENVSDREKEEIKNLSKEDLKDAFTGELLFGTGGMRGVLGLGSNRLNIYTATKAIRGFVNYLLENDKSIKKRGIVIGYDTRHYSDVFSSKAAEIFSHYEIPVFLLDNFRPTPFVSYAIRKLKASAGIMFTASHNPPEYNGIKFYNKNGTQLDLIESKDVICYVNKITDIFNINFKENKKKIKKTNIDKDFFEELKKVSFRKTKKDIKILYSPVGGTGGSVIPDFLKKLGYDITNYPPHEKPDPNFTNIESPNPEHEKAWSGIVKYAKDKKGIFDLIIMTDPDADRAGFGIKCGSDYLILNGNQQASVILYYILDSLKERKKLIKNNNVISTIVTTDLIKNIATDFGQNYISTLTGFKHIAKAIDDNGGSKKFTFGCEESIGAICSPFVRDKDSLSLALAFSEFISYLKDTKQDFISYYNNEIGKKYGYYLEYTKNVPLVGEKGVLIKGKIMDYIRENGFTLKGHNLIQKYDALIGSILTPSNKEIDKIDLPKENVLKFFYPFGWIAIRPSGTEPKIKIYFSVVSNNKDESEKLLNNIKDSVILEINKLYEKFDKE